MNRYKRANDLEKSLRRVEKTLSRLIDASQAGQMPPAVTSGVLDAWATVMQAKQLASRVSTDMLLGYSEAATEKRLAILVDGQQRARMIEDILEDVRNVPKDYAGGDDGR